MKLTKYEENVLMPIIIKDFNKNYTSAKKTITSKQYCDNLNNMDYCICDEVFRKIIKHIQKNNLVKFIVADSFGFHKTTSVKKLQEQIESLKKRENGIKQTRLALEKHLKNIL